MAVLGVIAFSKSLFFVLFVVPTSIILHSEAFIISGILKDPPISINSPRETITSFFFAKALRISITAAALLFTTNMSSAPVKYFNNSFKWSFRLPRFPVLRLNSRLL